MVCEQKVDDGSVLHCAQAGYQSALMEVERRFGGLLFRMAVGKCRRRGADRLLAYDVVQEVYVAMLDPTVARFRVGGSATGYLRGLVHNAARKVCATSGGDTEPLDSKTLTAPQSCSLGLQFADEEGLDLTGDRMVLARVIVGAVNGDAACQDLGVSRFTLYRRSEQMRRSYRALRVA